MVTHEQWTTGWELVLTTDDHGSFTFSMLLTSYRQVHLFTE